MMRRTLSAGDTFALRYVYPALNAVAFAIATGFFWWWSMKDGSRVITVAKWSFPVIGVASTIFGLRYGKRFKRVQVDDQALYISDYKTEIRVPFSDIENSSVRWKLSGHSSSTPIVTIEFCHPTVLGKQIEFVAAQPWNPSHSMVAELREWRDRAKA